MCITKGDMKRTNTDRNDNIIETTENEADEADTILHGTEHEAVAIVTLPGTC